MIGITTKSWVFTNAQTDFQMEAVDSTHAMIVYFVIATVAHSSSSDVAVRVGLATSTLPAITNNSATGNIGMAFTHGGIAPGGGAVASLGGDSPLVIGAADADLRITCSAATGGDLRVVVGYRMNDVS